ncbi:MAG: amino acid permease, partial [Sphingomonadaceae bacterium]
MSGRAQRLGLAAAFALVVGSMIGSGVFLLPASLARFGWNAVASWGVSILGALAIALTLAALARRLPATGGMAGCVATMLGPTAGY